MAWAYRITLILGITVSAWIWWRMARHDRRLPFVYICGLSGAMIGAKLLFLLAEGWLYLGTPEQNLQLATGKTILGALMGGYAGVELGKNLAGYSNPTGDRFAFVAPIGILLGRIGCLFYGCCTGIVCKGNVFAITGRDGTSRWPAVPMEIGFHASFLLLAALLKKAGLLKNQLFHLYLISYGIFRIWQEFFRSTPKLFLGISGYQIAAALLAIFGMVAFWSRRRKVLRLASLGRKKLCGRAAQRVNSERRGFDKIPKSNPRHHSLFLFHCDRGLFF